MQTNSPSASHALRSTRGASDLRDRVLLVCPVIGLLTAVVLLLEFGFALGTVVAFVFLVGCPLVAAWVLVIARQHAGVRRKP